MENAENITILANMTIVQNITILTNDTTTQRYTIIDLTPYTTYSYFVRAYSYDPGNDGPLYGDGAVLVVTTAED